MSGCQHKASIKKTTNYDDQIKRFKTKRYQLDFKVCISKLGVNDQQINKSLQSPPRKNKLTSGSIICGIVALRRFTNALGAT